MTTPIPAPASYPGTIKQFSLKIDGQIIYGAHVNEVQSEIVATETTLGPNPQVPAVLAPAATAPTTLSGRLGTIESNVVWASGGGQLIKGAKEFADITTFDAGVVEKGTVDHRPPTSGAGYRTFTDGSGVQAYTTTGGLADLLTQPSGGKLKRRGYQVWDQGNQGPGSGMDADTVDGYHATDFLIRQGCQVGMTANQNIAPCTLNGDTFATRTAVNLNTIIWEHTPGDGARLFSAGIFTIPTTGLWLVDVNMSWTGPWSGARAFSVRDGNYAPTSTSPNATTFMGHRELLGIGPPHWPDPTTYSPSGVFTSTTITPTLVDQARIMFLAAGTKLRVDAWNWNDVGLSAAVRAFADTHAHQPTTAVIAQVV